MRGDGRRTLRTYIWDVRVRHTTFTYFTLRGSLSPKEGVSSHADCRYIIFLRRTFLGNGLFHRHVFGSLVMFSFQKVIGRLRPCAQVPYVSDCLYGYTKLFGEPPNTKLFGDRQRVRQRTPKNREPRGSRGRHALAKGKPGFWATGNFFSFSLFFLFTSSTRSCPPMHTATAEGFI